MQAMPVSSKLPGVHIEVMQRRRGLADRPNRRVKRATDFRQWIYFPDRRRWQRSMCDQICVSGVETSRFGDRESGKQSRLFQPKENSWTQSIPGNGLYHDLSVVNPGDYLLSPHAYEDSDRPLTKIISISNWCVLKSGLTPKHRLELPYSPNLAGLPLIGESKLF
jgi:hypothetical protein